MSLHYFLYCKNSFFNVLAFLFLLLLRFYRPCSAFFYCWNFFSRFLLFFFFFSKFRDRLSLRSFFLPARLLFYLPHWHGFFFQNSLFPICLLYTFFTATHTFALSLSPPFFFIILELSHFTSEISLITQFLSLLPIILFRISALNDSSFPKHGNFSASRFHHDRKKNTPKRRRGYLSKGFAHWCVTGNFSPLHNGDTVRGKNQKESRRETSHSSRI